MWTKQMLYGLRPTTISRKEMGIAHAGSLFTELPDFPVRKLLDTVFNMLMSLPIISSVAMERLFSL